MESELYSVEQVAARLGLHVRTVRNYVRDGRLKAVRIGKQYRVARADLESFTGGPVPALPRDAAPRHRRVEVSSIVRIDAVDRPAADRIATTLMAATNSDRDGDGALRVQTVYDEQWATLQIVVLGAAGTTAALLKLVNTLSEAGS